MYIVSKTLHQAVGGRCAWCGRADRTLTEDHVFPRVLGGTKELWIPSCTECQTFISRAELEVGRSSFYSLFRLTQGPKGRDKRKPGSGLLEARYLGEGRPRRAPQGFHSGGQRAGGFKLCKTTISFGQDLQVR